MREPTNEAFRRDLLLQLLALHPLNIETVHNDPKHNAHHDDGHDDEKPHVEPVDEPKVLIPLDRIMFWQRKVRIETI